MEANTIAALMDYIWVPIGLALINLWHNLKRLESDVKKVLGVIQTTIKHQEDRRSEDVGRSKDDRAEILSKIDRHHTVVMQEIKEIRNLLKHGNQSQ